MCLLTDKYRSTPYYLILIKPKKMQIFDLYKSLDNIYSVAPRPKHVISEIRFSRWLRTQIDWTQFRKWNTFARHGSVWNSSEHFVKINRNTNINVNFSQNEKFKSKVLFPHGFSHSRDYVLSEIKIVLLYLRFYALN